MKRKITKLESLLLENGYTLKSKTYGGKHSQRTESYVYTTRIDNYEISVFLSPKREKVLYFTMDNNFKDTWDYISIEKLEYTYHLVQEQLDKITKECE